MNLHYTQLTSHCLVVFSRTICRWLVIEQGHDMHHQWAWHPELLRSRWRTSGPVRGSWRDPLDIWAPGYDATPTADILLGVYLDRMHTSWR